MLIKQTLSHRHNGIKRFRYERLMPIDNASDGGDFDKWHRAVFLAWQHGLTPSDVSDITGWPESVVSTVHEVFDEIFATGA